MIDLFSPKLIFALCDSMDGYVFQVNIAVFRHTEDWPQSWVSVCVSHIKISYYREGSMPAAMSDRMNAARKKDFIKE